MPKTVKKKDLVSPKLKILIATHNQSKLKRYKKLLGFIDSIDLVSLNDLDIAEKVEEVFDTNRENAIHKARIYGKLSGLPTISIDEALITNFLPDNEQPGVYVRRFLDGKSELSDEVLIDTWQKIFKLYPQADKQFIFNFAIAYYNPQNGIEHTDYVKQVSYQASYLSKNRRAGYPMSSFLSPKKDGKPYVEFDQLEADKIETANFSNFIKSFQKWLQ